MKITVKKIVKGDAVLLLIERPDTPPAEFVAHAGNTLEFQQRVLRTNMVALTNTEQQEYWEAKEA